jgi:hypothetical protein
MDLLGGILRYGTAAAATSPNYSHSGYFESMHTSMHTSLWTKIKQIWGYLKDPETNNN